MREIDRASTSWRLLAVGVGFVAIVAVALVIGAAHRGFEPSGQSLAAVLPPTATSTAAVAATPTHTSKATPAATAVRPKKKATPTRAAQPKRTATPKAKATSTRTPTPTPSPTPRPTQTSKGTPAATVTANSVATPASTPTPVAPKTYVIQHGDTLTSIAQKFNVTVQALAQLNQIPDPNYIVTGTTIKIPAH